MTTPGSSSFTVAAPRNDSMKSQHRDKAER
jgi:hypothetical protein